jgi:alpha-galactosidase
MKPVSIKKTLHCAFLACIPAVSTALALDNGLALTPPMGWNSWNRFMCSVDERIVKACADAMVNSGMKEAGYQYVVIDDCWMERDRDAQGNMVVNKSKFPSGMKEMGKYIHDKGLKFGIYTCPGTQTCQGLAGSYGHDQQDADMFAGWGVDYLKYDCCNIPSEVRDTTELYKRMHAAIVNTGRPMVFSIADWGLNRGWEWAQPYAHLYRTEWDIIGCYDCWRSWEPGARMDGFTGTIDKTENRGISDTHGPGHWLDPDMMQVGNTLGAWPDPVHPDTAPPLTVAESRAHFSIWCVVAAPLMAGNDISTMSPEIRDILTNKEVIAVDQDSLGIWGKRIRKDGDLWVWCKPLIDSTRAVVFFNKGEQPTADFSVGMQEIGLISDHVYKVRDLWKHADTTFKGVTYVAKAVPRHDVTMVKIGNPIPRPGGTGATPNGTLLHGAGGAPRESIVGIYSVDGRLVQGFGNAAHARIGNGGGSWSGRGFSFAVVKLDRGKYAGKVIFPR